MAANNVRIWERGHDPSEVILVPIASATVVERGDPISVQSSLATVFDLVTDDQYFVGIAIDDSVSGDATPIRVASKCVAQVTVASAAYTIGEGIMYVAGDATTAFSFTTASADTIGWSTEVSASTTTLKVLFDAVQLQKMFSSAA